jgi:hypothetical protein
MLSRPKARFALLAAGISAIALGSLSIARPAKAECYETAPLPLVHRNWLYRDVEVPGYYEVTRKPALYGFRTRKVVTDPGRVIVHEEPPVYKTVPVKVKVGGGSGWKHCSTPEKDIACRVKVPVHYETREKQVLVKGGHRWEERTPPTFAYVTERVLLRPYRNISHHERPAVRFHRERVTIQPEGERWAPVRGKPDCDPR